MSTRNKGQILQRQRPKIEVPRGYIGVDTANALTAAYPAAPGVNILSGQLIEATQDNLWILGGGPVNTDFVGSGQFYYAINDLQDADVREAGKLPGLSSNGQYEIETAFFTPVQSGYAKGDKLVPDPSAPGFVTKYDPTDTDQAGLAFVGEVVTVLTAEEVIAKNSEVIPYIDSGAGYVLNTDAAVIRLRTPVRANAA